MGLVLRLFSLSTARWLNISGDAPAHTGKRTWRLGIYTTEKCAPTKKRALEQSAKRI